MKELALSLIISAKIIPDNTVNIITKLYIPTVVLHKMRKKPSFTYIPYSSDIM